MLVHAQQIVLGAWTLLAAVFLGLAFLERRLFGPPLRTGSDLWLSFWVGWALLLVGLELWHSFLPVDDRARYAFAALGAVGWIAGGAAPWRIAARLLRRHAVAIVLCVAAAVWLSNQSMAGPRFGDTGMYLVPTMHWYESFAVVPGLANVFVPLGNNITYFLYGALLDGGPFRTHVYPLINTLLALALLARGIFAMWRLLLGRSVRVDADVSAEAAAGADVSVDAAADDGVARATNDAGIVGDLFYALALVPLSEILFSLYLTSPMPDTAVFLFGLVLAGELFELVADRTPSRSRMLRLVFLSATALTIKLSIAGLALAAPAVALVWWIWRTRPSVAHVARTIAAAIAVALVPVGPWIARNIVLSGYPLYPAMIFPMPVDWIARVDATAWIRKPMELAPLWTIFRDWKWWQSRLISLGWDGTDVMRPLAMLALGFAAIAVAKPAQWLRRRASPFPFFVFLAPVAAFVFTFLNTPMPRYQGATLWMFGVGFLVLAIATIDGAAGRVARALCVVAVAVVCVAPKERRDAMWLPLQDFESTSPPRLHTETLASGLTVQVPENQVCWYAPLPCTPEPHPGLRLRDPGNLARGFAIDLSTPPKNGADVAAP